MKAVAENRGGIAPLFFTAPRGLGKTVLLKEVEAVGRDEGLVVASVTADSETDLCVAIAVAIRREIERMGPGLVSRIRGSLDELSLSVGLGGTTARATWRRDDAATDEPFGVALSRLVQELGGAGGLGLVLTVDELQEASQGSLRRLLPALQQLGHEHDPVPFVFIGAGLTSMSRTLARAYGFSERFEYLELHRLDPTAAGLALQAGLDSDVDWLGTAVEEAIAAADGHPYLIQLIGYWAWEESGASTALKPGILPGDVQVAISEASGEIRRIFATRWEDASDVEKAVLGAVAHLGNGTYPGIATSAGLELGETESAVRKLNDDGWLEVIDLERVAFAYAGLATYVASRVGMAPETLALGSQVLPADVTLDDG
ncbi:hypothetical protein Back2_07140 [Nocardioides baekrokdamisoli]|uniref:Uncharacterized protein n=2 Tax=Nocardioides baekrokdamisoli TaxID=1804624 RepID=A0A3G9IC12_9ACTN|nr:hypothetical protein Back2_07140 [Nocardioides baekrokdamisoli]